MRAKLKSWNKLAEAELPIWNFFFFLRNPMKTVEMIIIGFDWLSTH